LQADLRGDQLEVVFVAPGSPAARGGWRAGQRIRAIDGHAIRPDYAATQQQWLYGPAGAKVVLTDSKGAHRSLTLAEYY
jgi:C-terminal processing protease CtpA/Prc